MVRVCESNIVFRCVHLSVPPSSVHLCYAISKTSGWNSTKLATSLPPIVSVCEQQHFSVHLFFCVSAVLPPVHHTIFTRGNSTKLATPLPLMARATFFFCTFIYLCICHLSVTLSPSKPLGGIQPNLLHHFPSW